MKSIFIAIVLYHLAISYAFVRPLRPRLGLLLPDKSRELEIAEEELIRCRGSLNPYDWLQIPYLKEKLNIAKDRLTRKLREDDRKLQEDDRKLREDDRKLREDDRKRQDERKVVKLNYEYSDGEIISMGLSRQIFYDWNKNDKYLFDLGGKIMINYEDVVSGNSYFVVPKKLQSNFESFAAIEAGIQTTDCVECILNGSLLFPPFNEDGTIVIYEYNIAFQNDTQVQGNKFRSPVRPDAVLIHGDKWLVLEAKHAFTTSLMNDFQAKCDFIRSNADQPWVRKKHPVPTAFTFVACSINSYSAAKSNNPEIIRVVRDGTAYKKIPSD
jgi:hypothetical protein